MPTCTTADIDIVINPNLATVASTVGFAIGDTVSVANAVGAGQDLITTITNIVGLDITLQDAAAATITGEQFCKIGSGTNTGWFGPDGPCECGCTCTCDEARDDYSDASIAFSNGATAQTLVNSQRLAYDCYGVDSSMFVDYSFPGIANASSAIDSNACVTNAGNSAAIPPGLYGMTIDGSCNIWIGHGIFRYTPSAFVSGNAGVLYRCVDGVYARTVSVWAHYPIFTKLDLGFAWFNTATYPGWTWEVFGLVLGGIGGYRGTATVGNVSFLYTLSLTGQNGIHQFGEMFMYGSSDVDLTINLSDAPAHFDPLGFLVGTATLTP